jgi:hypothetical protein
LPRNFGSCHGCARRSAELVGRLASLRGSWWDRPVAGATGRREAVLDEDADYVVVGAGTAGCILAARLSEDPGARVVLLEAGPADRDLWIHLPAGYARLLASGRYD